MWNGDDSLISSADIYLDSTMFKRLMSNENFFVIWILGVVQAVLEIIWFTGFAASNSLLIILKGQDCSHFGDPAVILTAEMVTNSLFL